MDFCAHSAFLADVSEVGGESIAEIDHGRGETPVRQCPAHLNPWGWMEVTGIVRRPQLSSGEQQIQSSGRSAQLASHINAIPGTRPRAPDCLTARRRTNDHDICQNSVSGLGRISAGEHHVKLVRQLQQTPQEAVDPGLRQIPGQCERQKGSDRPASHGRNIAKSASQATTADYLRGMPFPAEMNSFQCKVRCNQGFVAGRNVEDSTIVPDAHDYVRRLTGLSANAGNQRFFSQRQANSIYRIASGSEELGCQNSIWNERHPRYQSNLGEVTANRAVRQRHRTAFRNSEG